MFCRLFHHCYYKNRNIFVRSAVSTDYLELEVSTYGSYYPAREGFDRTLGRILDSFGFSLPFGNRCRDVANLLRAVREHIPAGEVAQQNFQLSVLNCPFYRNKAAYIIGNAIKLLAAANIFPGDLLLKNFGVTRQGRVVFYDYDEICYLTECHFRRSPPPSYPECELDAEPWFSADQAGVFPEELANFLLTSPRVRQVFVALHRDLLDPDYWWQRQDDILRGRLADVFPYPESKRIGPGSYPRLELLAAEPVIPLAGGG